MVEQAPRSRRRRAVAVGLGTAVLAGGAAGGVAVAKTPGFVLGVHHVNHKVTQGNSNNYYVRLKNSGQKQVSLRIAGDLPDGVTAQWESTLLGPTDRMVKLTLRTTTATPPGIAAINVQGTSGSETRTLKLFLNVWRAFNVDASPETQQVLPGTTGTYNLAIRRRFAVGSVALSVTGLPAGATAAFQPSATVSGNTATLAVTTTAATPPGTYALTVGGKGLLFTATDVVNLVVAAPQPFSIAGAVGAPLSPGVGTGLNLSLTNPMSVDMTINSVGGSVTAVNAPNATADLPCTVADFELAPATGLPKTLPAKSTKTLAQLGLTPDQLPVVSMLDTDANQDGCKGATFSITYTGSGQGGD